jgi:peptidoglycan LD-endopeptidase LytH
MIQLFRFLAPDSADLLEFPLRGQHFPKIDLSIQNLKATSASIYERETLFGFVEGEKIRLHSHLLWGGYLEQRLIYASSSVFHQDAHPRNLHLGLDFWVNAGTKVFAPLAGKIHSFQDNSAFRDYGPTVVVAHEFEGMTFHSLYGHLSRATLEGLKRGQIVQKGQLLGQIGPEAENGQWPPHLHFQLVIDMEGKMGDYPGVCALENLAHYQANCPDPRFLLGI